MREKLIELFTKVGNETDTFAPFVTCDQFENLADEIVKLCNLQNVSQRSELLNAFFEYLDSLPPKEYDANSLTGHGENWLKSI